MTKSVTRYDSIAKAREALVSTFPATFKGRHQSKLPLKIGIYADIREEMPEIGAKRLKAALADYTSGPTYLREVKVGAVRIDLHGNSAGDVLPEQEAYAKRRMVEVIEMRAKRKAERSASAKVSTEGEQPSP